MIWLNKQSALKIETSALCVATTLILASALEVHLKQIRCQMYGFGNIVRRTCIVLSPSPDGRAFQIRGCVLGIELNRLAEVGFCAGEIVLAITTNAAE